MSANAALIDELMALTGPHTQPEKFRAYLEGRPRPSLEKKRQDLLDDESKLRLGRVHLPPRDRALGRRTAVMTKR